MNLLKEVPRSIFNNVCEVDKEKSTEAYLFTFQKFTKKFV